MYTHIQYVSGIVYGLYVWVVCIFWDTCTGKGNNTWLFSVYGLKRFVVSMNRYGILYTTQATWASFPNSHTQTTWSLIPRLSYPNSHTQTPRNLVPKLSLTSVLFSIILSWLQAFIGVTSFYSSRPLLCDSQTLIPKLSYPDPTEPYYSLVRCCVPVANVLASKNLQACCDDTIFFTWASGGCDNMPIRLITKDQSTHEIFALEKGLPVSMMQATKSW